MNVYTSESEGKTVTVTEDDAGQVSVSITDSLPPAPAPRLDLQIGDRVRSLAAVGYPMQRTTVLGTIRRKHSSTDLFLVEFDENIGGHRGLVGGDELRDGCGWWLADRFLERVD